MCILYLVLLIIFWGVYSRVLLLTNNTGTVLTSIVRFPLFLLLLLSFFFSFFAFFLFYLCVFFLCFFFLFFVFFSFCFVCFVLFFLGFFLLTYFLLQQQTRFSPWRVMYFKGKCSPSYKQNKLVMFNRFGGRENLLENISRSSVLVTMPAP